MKMAEELDLKRIERKAYTSTFQDGLLDMDFGVLLLGGGVNMYLGSIIDSPWIALLFIIYAIIGLSVYLLGKKYITIPRLGVVKFGPKRRANLKKLVLITILSVIATIVVLIITISDAIQIVWFEGMGGIIIMALLIITLPLSLIAYFLDYPRLYLIAVLFGLSWPFSDLLIPYVGKGLSGLLAYGLIGSSVLIMGLVYLFVFIRKYPPLKEIANGSQ